MDYKKILTGLLVTAYKLDQAKIDEILAEGREEAEITTDLLTADTVRVEALSKPKQGQTFQDGYAKGKGEVLTTFEASLKEKYGVTSDLKGDELIAEIVKQKTTGNGSAEPTEDQIRKHPIYLNAKKEVAEKEKEWKEKYDKREADLKSNEVKGKAKAQALEILDGMKPVLPSNATVAQTQKTMFANLLNDYEIEYPEGSTTPVISKNGTVLQDNHGNNITLEGLVKEKASSFFEFQNNNGGGNSGNNNNGGGGNEGKKYPAGITRPKTIEEFAKIIDDQSISLEDRAIVSEGWDADQTK